MKGQGGSEWMGNRGRAFTAEAQGRRGCGSPGEQRGTHGIQSLLNTRRKQDTGSER